VQTAVPDLDNNVPTIIPDVPKVSDTATELAEGTVVHGRYTIERKIGAGGMGVVYLASDRVTGRKVALKLINSALTESDTARERFLREGLIARDIRHQNVVAVYDVGEAGGQFYLVMEYLPGETLRRFLLRYSQQGSSVQASMMIVRNLLEGLGAAHVLGIVHRDLKPENIILLGDPNQGDCRLKILDFGIARAFGESGKKLLTTKSSSTGSPLYMAPEQKTRADTVRPSADLYAVTVIFYELLMGVVPTGPFMAPSKERPEIPSTIDGVIEKGLSNYPPSRFQSVQEYLDALDRKQPPSEEPKPEPAKPKEPAEASGWQVVMEADRRYWKEVGRALSWQGKEESGNDSPEGKGTARMGRWKALMDADRRYRQDVGRAVGWYRLSQKTRKVIVAIAVIWAALYFIAIITGNY
jgi:serine/threonine protein kinase